VENAFKFTTEGSIQLAYSFFIEDGKDFIQFSVKDTGVGIGKENHEMIFKRFSQEDKELSKSVGGLGLGLSIANENARLLGGHIALVSEKGKGAEFIVKLPINIVELNNSNLKQIPKKKIKAVDKTILVVEDENTNYYLLKSFLEECCGFEGELLHAKNGQEALDICNGNSNVDLIFMDLKMPVMDGFEATEKIKSIRPQVPIVAQSAYSVDDDIEKALGSGCSDFISKPIDQNEFYRITAKYIREVVS
jgi:CheY-like chemotaxis protein